MRKFIVSWLIVSVGITAWLVVMGTIFKHRLPTKPSAASVPTLDIGASGYTPGDTLCYWARMAEDGGQVWYLDVPKVTVLDSTGQAYRLPDGRGLEDIPARQVADMEEIPNTMLKMHIVRTTLWVRAQDGRIVRQDPPTIIRKGFDLDDLIDRDRRDQARRLSTLAGR